MVQSDSPLVETLSPSPEPSSPHIITRSIIGNLRPEEFPSFHLYKSAKSTKHPLKAFLSTSLPHEPITFSQAISDPSWWLATMESEYQALLENGAWHLCLRPSNRNII